MKKNFLSLTSFHYITVEINHSLPSMMSLMWQSSKTLVESNLYLFQNEIETDVEFLAGNEDKEIVRAHRIILASRSPVFHAMFYGDMREQGNVISLPDITPDSLKCFLT